MKTSKVIAIVLISLVLPACGKVAYRDDSLSSATTAQIPTTTDTGTGSAGGSTGGGSNLLPPYKFTASLQGQAKYTSPNINADKVLNVRIVAGTSGGYSTGVSGSTGSAPYNCVRYNVTVFNKTITTNLLSPTGGSTNCPNAPSSQEIQFSGELYPGHGPVNVIVSEVNTDVRYMFCMNCLGGCYVWGYWPSACQQFYPVSPQYTTHLSNFRLEVQTDITSF